MSQQQAVLDQFKVSLTKSIGGWLNRRLDDGSWDQLNAYISDNLVEAMANGALSVLAGVVDLNNFLHEEELLK